MAMFRPHILVLILSVLVEASPLTAQNKTLSCQISLSVSSHPLDLPKIEFIKAETGDVELSEEQKDWIRQQFRDVARLMPMDYSLPQDSVKIRTGKTVNHDQYQWKKKVIDLTDPVLREQLDAIVRHEIGHYYFHRYFFNQRSSHKEGWKNFLSDIEGSGKPRHLFSSLRYARIFFLISPYNELFADLVSAMSCGDGACMARALAWALLKGDASDASLAKVLSAPQWQAIKLFDLREDHSIEDIIRLSVPEKVVFDFTELEPHLHLSRARSLIYQDYERSLAEQLGPQTFIRILLKTILEESHGFWGMGSFFKSKVIQADRANHDLYQRFRHNVDEYMKHNP